VSRLDEAIPAESGFDRTPEHRFGSLQLNHELRVRDWLRSNPQGRQRHRDMIVAEEFESIREYVEDACREANVRPPQALQAGSWGPESADAMRGLVRSVPSADTWSTLRFLKHRDRTSRGNGMTGPTSGSLGRNPILRFEKGSSLRDC